MPQGRRLHNNAFTITCGCKPQWKDFIPRSGGSCKTKPNNNKKSALIKKETPESFALELNIVFSSLSGTLKRILHIKLLGKLWRNYLFNKVYFTKQKKKLLFVRWQIFPNISWSKINQKMKFGQLIEYNKRNIFL